MNNKRKFCIALIVVLVLSMVVGIIVGCGNNQEIIPEKKIVIGAKGFTNNIIPAEILAQLVEAKTDIKVDRQFELPTALIHPAILNGDVDVYPEYTGTGLLVMLKEQPMTNRQLVYDKVKEEYAKLYNITWSAPLGFSSGYGLAITKDKAQELGIKTFSDLAKYSEQLVFGAEFDFYERPEGHDAMSEFYGFKFIEKQEMDGSLKYQAIGQGLIDVVVVYEDDGLIEVFDLQVLEDDKQFFVPYDTAFLVRDEIKNKYPELMEIIDSLAGKITLTDVQAMASAVDKDNKAISTVVREYIEKNI